jgi:hypothetical protein
LSGTAGAGAYLIGTYTGTDTGLSSVTVNSYGSGSSVLHGALIDDGAGTGSTNGIYLDEYRLATVSTITTPVALGNVHVGGTFGTSTLSISNTAATDGFSEKLDASFGTLTGSASTSGGPISLLAAGSTSTAMSVGLGSGAQSTAGAAAGTIVIQLNSDGSGTSGAGTTSLTSQTVAVSGGVYQYANANTIGTVNVGNTRVGTAETSTITLSNTDTNVANYTESLTSSGFTGTSSGFTATGTVSTPLVAGASNSSSLVVGVSAPLTAGQLSGSTILNLTSNAVSGSGLSNTNSTQSVTITGAAYNYASAVYSGATLAFGNVHEGATASQTVAFSNQTVTNASYQDSLNVSATTGNSLVTATGFTGLLAGTNGNLTIGVNTSTTGSLASTESLTLVSNDNGVTGLSNGTPTVVGGGTIATTGEVYSGQSTWATNAGGTWGSLTSNFGSNWGASQGSPGLDSGFTHSDTATFGTAVAGNTTAHVTLDVTGNNPSLKAITFDDTNAGAVYSIDQGTGSGSLLLNGTGNSGNLASVTNSNGANIITGPVGLTTSANVNVASGQQLTVSGAISGTGTGLNIVTGTGTTILSYATGNGYTGPTAISAGTLYANNTTSGSATGSGAVTVGTGMANTGTLAGTGTITSSGLTINGGGTLASGDAQSSTSGTVDGTHLTVYNTPITVSGDAPANLTFDLGAGNSGFYGTSPGSPGYQTFSNPNNNTTYMVLSGSSTITFSGSDSISLVDLTNLNGTGIGTLALRLATPYLLIHAGSNADYLNLVINSGTLANPQYSLSQNDGSLNGFIAGVYTGDLADPTSGQIAGDLGTISIQEYGSNGVTPLSAGTGGIYVAPVLYLDAGNLEVVPEPGTWAMILGGLVLLVVIQRRKRNI